MKKVLIKRQKTEFIPSSEMKCPESGIFVNSIIGWGLSGKAILQVSMALFSGTDEIFFGQRWHTPIKNWPIREGEIIPLTLAP